MPQSSDISRKSPIRVIARFAVRLVVLAAFAGFDSIGFGAGLVALLSMSIILCAIAGLVLREPPFGTSLNHWDESVAFGALFALVHIV